MNNQKRTKTGIIASIVVILIIAGISLVYQDWIKAYYENFTLNHYHEGDRVEISDKYIGLAESIGFPLCRLAKSDAGYDIVPGNKDISANKIKTYKAKSIGTYVDYKIVSLTGPDGKRAIGQLYAIKPDLQLIDKNSFTEDLKPGYTFIDDNYYIFSVGMVK